MLPPLIGLWSAWSLYNLTKSRFFHLEATTPQKGSLHVKDLVGAFAIFFLSYGFLAPLLISYFSLSSAKEVVALSVFTLLWLGYVWLIRDRLSPYFTPPGFLKGVKCWFNVFPLILVWSLAVQWGVATFLDPSSRDQIAVSILKSYRETPLLFGTLAALIVTVVPVIEEMLFRGFLQTVLKGWTGARVAIIFTALTFALFHYSPEQGWSNITLLSSLFILGLFLGVLMEKTKSLKAPIALHMTYNLVSVLLLIQEGL